jgi:hypothetical protein
MFLKALISMIKYLYHVYKKIVYLSCNTKMVGPKLTLHRPMHDIGGW